MPEILDPPAISTAANAERPAADPTLRFQAPRHVPHPAIAVLMGKADAVRAEGEESLNRAANLTGEARALDQKIASLQAESNELQARLFIIESRNLTAEKASATDTFNRFYGVPALPHHQMESLNSAVVFLGTLAVVERLAPILLKTLKTRLAEIDKELAALESTK